MMQFVDVFSKDSIKERDKKTLVVRGVRREKKKLKRSPIWDKEKIINQIKEIKAKNEPLSPGYLQKNYCSLYHAISRHFGEGSFKEGYRKALSIARVKSERIRSVSNREWWNKEKIISRIKEIKAGNEPLYPSYLSKNYRGLYHAISRYFGEGSFKEGYKKVLSAAGVEPEKSKRFPIWDKEKIISKLKEIKARHEPLYLNYLRKNYTSLYRAIYRYFGSFKGYRKALLAAGLKPAKVSKCFFTWNKEKIINQLKEIKAKNEPLFPVYLQKNYCGLYHAISRHFGGGSFKEGYRKALSIARIKPERIRSASDREWWNKEKIISRIKEIKAGNEPLYPSYLSKNYKGLYHAISRYFGEGSFKEGYKKVLSAVGVEPEKSKKFPIWDKEKIISQIKEIKARREPLYLNYLGKNYRSLYSAIYRYFGSFKEGYRKALLAAGLKPMKAPKSLRIWNKEKIVNQLKEIKARNEPLYLRYLFKNYLSLYSAICRYFGEGSIKKGYREALLAAGIPPEKGRKGLPSIWNKEKIISQIKEIKARNEPLHPKYLRKNYPRLYNAICRCF